MITITVDADTGIIVTGATKPAAPKIQIFEDAAANITRIRVGEDFGSIVTNCSRDVWQRFSKVKKKLDSKLTEEQSAVLYHAVVKADKETMPSYPGIPSSKSCIMSWAFGNDFTFRSPCTRCQRLYSNWTLHKIPQTPDEMLAILLQDKQSGSLKYSPTFTYPCGYCAETVAAAKLYLLRHGTLTLTLPRDTEEIRASDKVKG